MHFVNPKRYNWLLTDLVVQMVPFPAVGPQPPVKVAASREPLHQDLHSGRADGAVATPNEFEAACLISPAQDRNHDSMRVLLELLTESSQSQLVPCAAKV